jgi:Eukaryotic-type carbonic anhydrase
MDWTDWYISPLFLDSASSTESANLEPVADFCVLFLVSCIIHTQLGNVAIFLVKGTDNDHYDFLELYLHQWAKVASQVNTDCTARARARQQQLQTTTTTTTAMLETMLEIDGIDDGEDDLDDELFDQGWRALFMKETIEIDQSDLPLDPDDRNNNDEEADNANNADDGHRGLGQIFNHRRHPTCSPTRSPAPSYTPQLTNTLTVVIQVLEFQYYNRLWHPYDWLEKCKTEYYFQYFGNLVEPLCVVGIHWHVMKNPIKISPRQLRILENLTAKRQDPVTCKENSTVGKPRVNVTSKVDVNRPIQLMSNRQYLAFCECVNWNPSIIENKIYCNQTMEQRGVYPRM